MWSECQNEPTNQMHRLLIKDILLRGFDHFMLINANEPACLRACPVIMVLLLLLLLFVVLFSLRFVVLSSSLQW